MNDVDSDEGRRLAGKVIYDLGADDRRLASIAQAVNRQRHSIMQRIAEMAEPFAALAADLDSVEIGMTIWENHERYPPRTPGLPSDREVVAIDPALWTTTRQTPDGLIRLPVIGYQPRVKIRKETGKLSKGQGTHWTNWLDDDGRDRWISGFAISPAGDAEPASFLDETSCREFPAESPDDGLVTDLTLARLL